MPAPPAPVRPQTCAPPTVAASLVGDQPWRPPHASVILVAGVAALLVGTTGLLLLRWWR